MTYLGLQQIIRHEIGHIVLGHVDYKNNILIDGITSQALEIDADDYAIRGSLRFVKRLYTNNDPSVKLSNNDFETFLKVWFLSVFLTFRLFVLLSIIII